MTFIMPSKDMKNGFATISSDEDWWRGAVIYQIYPRSFQDSNGDGVGDLAGITARLGYVAALGVDAIWLSPFFASPQKDFGYDISDYCNVDPMFGSLDDFDALIAEAHRLGLRVMIDQVLSHASSQHPWFIESRSSRTNPKADWFVWADMQPDGSPPNNWLSVFGGSSWQWDSTRRQYYLHNFLAEQPDVNLLNPEAQDAILDTVRFWLERGVDGFRLDTTNFYCHDARLRSNPPADFVEKSKEIEPYHYQNHLFDKNRPETVDFLRRFRALLNEYPGSASVGEIGYGPQSLDLMAEYTSNNDKLNMAYTFDFLGDEYDADIFRKRIARFEEKAAGSWPCWAFSNHDVSRHVSRWHEHADDVGRLAKLMGSLLLSLRGSVCCYEGEELGLTEAELAYEDLVDPYGIRLWPEFKGRDGCRTPMPWDSRADHAGFSPARPWLPVDSNHLPLAVNRQETDPTSVLSHYRAFLAFRRAHQAMIKGDIELLPASVGGEPILAFRRMYADEEVLCVFNLGRLPARYKPPFDVSTFSALEVPSFRNSVSDGVISLEGTSAFFGKIERK
ncbi:alpha-glucosidase [Martelella lutilitoris]